MTTKDMKTLTFGSTTYTVVDATARSSINTLSGNLVTFISSSSTDSQYPSAKCTYDNVSYVQARSATINDYYYLSSSASGNISVPLEDNVSIYEYIPSGNCTFTFSTTGITTDISAPVLPSPSVYYSSYTFELLISMTSTVYSMTFPSGVTWLNAKTPDLSATGNYLLVFRTFDGGTTWVGNLQGKW